jgi:hypothetical protein
MLRLEVLMKRLLLTMFAACAVAMAQPECSLQTLRGTYAVSYSGIVTAPAGSAFVTILGVISVDPSRSPFISGGITFAGFGPTPMFVPASGTVQVNADCTGTIRLGNPATGETEVDQFMYDQHSQSLQATVIKIALGNVAALGTWKKISPVPGIATWQAPPQ